MANKPQERVLASILISILFSVIEELSSTRKLDTGKAIHSKDTELLSTLYPIVYRVVTNEVVLLEARESIRELFIG